MEAPAAGASGAAAVTPSIDRYKLFDMLPRIIATIQDCIEDYPYGSKTKDTPTYERLLPLAKALLTSVSFGTDAKFATACAAYEAVLSDLPPEDIEQYKLSIRAPPTIEDLNTLIERLRKELAEVNHYLSTEPDGEHVDAAILAKYRISEELDSAYDTYTSARSAAGLRP